MPIPFQLTLELSNIVKPLVQGLAAVGSLAYAERAKRAGSDILTETKLEALLGFHRIDPIIATHFRQAVIKSDQTLLSQCLEMALESGSGPTVQAALREPTMFSMIVQLSALAFAHEHDSLAGALVIAAERILTHADKSMENAPHYGSLIGTIKACQQQTAGFYWSSIYESVERRIKVGLKNEVREPLFKDPDLLERSLPFPVLQFLLMWLRSVQNLPDHRLLHIRTRTGISTAVVWCHHVLGLTVSVRIGDTNVVFGKVAATVIIVGSATPADSSASLLDASSPDEPLFTLGRLPEDPTITPEIRANAYGYGMEVLRQLFSADEDDYINCALYIVHRACLSLDKTKSRSRAIHLPHVRRYLRFAGAFLFGLGQLDRNLIMATNLDSESYGGEPRILHQKPWHGLMAVLISFARVPSLLDCTRMPLSIEVFLRQHAAETLDWSFERLLNEGVNIETYEFDKSRSPSAYLLRNSAAYSLLARLLVGRTYSEDYISSSCLISAWGWSVMFDSVDATDPSDVCTETIRVLYGVPSRHGVRQSRIVNGPAVLWQGPPEQHRRYLRKAPDGSLFPSNSQVEYGPFFVGHGGRDSIAATRTFLIRPLSPEDDEGKLQLGIREMHTICTRFLQLPPCSCLGTTLSFARISGTCTLELMAEQNTGRPVRFVWEPWSLEVSDNNDWDAEGVLARGYREPEKAMQTPGSRAGEMTYSDGSASAREDEDDDDSDTDTESGRVHDHSDIWFLSRARSSAARWAQLAGLYHQDFIYHAGRPTHNYFRKHPSCCLHCAVQFIHLNYAYDPQLPTIVLD